MYTYTYTYTCQGDRSFLLILFHEKFQCSLASSGHLCLVPRFPSPGISFKLRRSGRTQAHIHSSTVCTFNHTLLIFSHLVFCLLGFEGKVNSANALHP